MQRWALVILAVVAATSLTGCGGSKSSATSTTSRGASGQAAGASSAAAGIRGRVLTEGELAGFTPAPRSAVEFTPEAWLTAAQTPPTQMASETARLKRLGFVAGVREDLIGGYGQLDGLSVVEKFRTPTAARSEVAVQEAYSKQGLGPTDRYFTFAAPGIPTGHGFGVSSTGSAGMNVVFADGDYYYLVGEGGGALSDLKHSALVAAAQSLYRRVHA